MSTIDSTENAVAPQCGEPVLPRRALLATLDDRKTIIAVVQRRPYTMVSVTSWFNGKTYDGVGFSKVCYPDGWDDELGADISANRALIDIYHQVRWDEVIARLSKMIGDVLLNALPDVVDRHLV